MLLIGDEALQHNKHGLEGFELVYDLAREWYDWKKLPFVFAVWAVKKALPAVDKARALGDDRRIAPQDGRPVPRDRRAPRENPGTLRPAYAEEYLEGFNYTLGDREREAMREFRKLHRPTVTPGR